MATMKRSLGRKADGTIGMIDKDNPPSVNSMASTASSPLRSSGSTTATSSSTGREHWDALHEIAKRNKQKRTDKLNAADQTASGNDKAPNLGDNRTIPSKQENKSPGPLEAGTKPTICSQGHTKGIRCAGTTPAQECAQVGHLDSSSWKTKEAELNEVACEQPVIRKDLPDASREKENERGRTTAPTYSLIPKQQRGCQSIINQERSSSSGSVQTVIRHISPAPNSSRAPSRGEVTRIASGKRTPNRHDVSSKLAVYPTGTMSAHQRPLTPLPSPAWNPRLHPAYQSCPSGIFPVLKAHKVGAVVEGLDRRCKDKTTASDETAYERRPSARVQQILQDIRKLKIAQFTDSSDEDDAQQETSSIGLFGTNLPALINKDATENLIEASGEIVIPKSRLPAKNQKPRSSGAPRLSPRKIADNQLNADPEGVTGDLVRIFNEEPPFKHQPAPASLQQESTSTAAQAGAEEQKISQATPKRSFSPHRTRTSTNSSENSTSQRPGRLVRAKRSFYRIMNPSSTHQIADPMPDQMSFPSTPRSSASITNGSVNLENRFGRLRILDPGDRCDGFSSDSYQAGCERAGRSPSSTSKQYEMIEDVQLSVKTPDAVDTDNPMSLCQTASGVSDKDGEPAARIDQIAEWAFASSYNKGKVIYDNSMPKCEQCGKESHMLKPCRNECHTAYLCSAKCHKKHQKQCPIIVADQHGAMAKLLREKINTGASKPKNKQQQHQFSTLRIPSFDNAGEGPSNAPVPSMSISGIEKSSARAYLVRLFSGSKGVKAITSSASTPKQGPGEFVRLNRELQKNIEIISKYWYDDGDDKLWSSIRTELGFGKEHATEENHWHMVMDRLFRRTFELPAIPANELDVRTQHPNHNLDRHTVMLWCKRCLGACAGCGSPCCIVQGLKARFYDRSLPVCGEDFNALAEMLETIKMWLREGQDAPSLAACDACVREGGKGKKRRYCAECFGICSLDDEAGIPACRDVLCMRHNPRKDTICKRHSGRPKCGREK